MWTVDIKIVICLLAAHWVGDYLLQFNSIANQKAKSTSWLSLHVLIYSTVIFATTSLLIPTRIAILYTAVNAALHFVTDFFTSRMTLKYKENPRMFHLMIGMDQLIHTVTLVLTYTM